MKYPSLFAKRFILLLIPLLSVWNLYAQRKQIVVAADGSGLFTKVQDAFNAVPDNATETTFIFVKKGTYKEKLVLPASKNHVTLIGEDRNQTIITYDDYHARLDSTGKEIGTSGSASFHIYGSDFTAANITFQNSAGPGDQVGQAVAVWVAGDRAFFKDCNFKGFQDTLYTFGYGTRQLYQNCYIEGTIDFIFGASTAWFEDCRIFCKADSGYVTAASTPDSVKYGYVFYHCNIGGDAAAATYCLGRPWRMYAKTVYISCNLGAQIKPEGWAIWSNKDKLNTTYYAEYKNTGEGFTPSKRAAWSHQLTDAEAAQYTKKNVLRGWEPALPDVKFIK